MSDYGHRHYLEAVQPACTGHIANLGDAIREPDKGNGGRHGEAQPGGNAPPSMPARVIPTAMPTWLLAGPGRNWQRATISA